MISCKRRNTSNRLKHWSMHSIKCTQEKTFYNWMKMLTVLNNINAWCNKCFSMLLVFPPMHEIRVLAMLHYSLKLNHTLNGFCVLSCPFLHYRFRLFCCHSHWLPLTRGTQTQEIDKVIGKHRGKWCWWIEPVWTSYQLDNYKQQCTAKNSFTVYTCHVHFHLLPSVYNILLKHEFCCQHKNLNLC